MILLRKKTGHDRTRVCNEQCYDAKSKTCHCICGGVNHGLGVVSARRNGALIFAPRVETDPTLEVVSHQESLFPPER